MRIFFAASTSGFLYSTILSAARTSFGFTDFSSGYSTTLTRVVAFATNRIFNYRNENIPISAFITKDPTIKVIFSVKKSVSFVIIFRMNVIIYIIL